MDSAWNDDRIVIFFVARWDKRAGTGVVFHVSSVLHSVPAFSDWRPGGRGCKTSGGCGVLFAHQGKSVLPWAVLSLCKMAAERNFGQRIGYFLSYVCEVAKSGNWKLYGEDMEDARNRKKGTIHFALPVLLGVAIYKGGMGL